MWHISGTTVTTQGFYRSSCDCGVRVAFGVDAPFANCPRCRAPVGWRFEQSYADVSSLLQGLFGTAGDPEVRVPA